MSDTNPIVDVKGLTEALAGTPADADGDGAAEALPEVEALDARQRFALEDLMAGRSYSEAARNAGVDRRTLYRWVNHDPAFRAAMNAWREQAIGSAEAQLTQATEAAVATLRIAATRDFRAAALLLKGRGLLSGSGSGRQPRPAVEPRELPIPAGRFRDFEVRLRELILSVREEPKAPAVTSLPPATAPGDTPRSPAPESAEKLEP